MSAGKSASNHLSPITDENIIIRKMMNHQFKCLTTWHVIYGMDGDIIGLRGDYVVPIVLLNRSGTPPSCYHREQYSITMIGWIEYLMQITEDNVNINKIVRTSYAQWK